MKVEEGFQQPLPATTNGFTDDILLPSLLKRLIPNEVLEPITRDLQRLGDDLNGPIRAYGQLADAPPTLTQYSEWGRRVDTLYTSEGWRKLKGVAAKEGLVGISYERLYGQWSRIYAFAKTLLFVAEGRVVGCPISMTDGCARVLELHGTPEMKEDILSRLVTRHTKWAFTAGQFMTERPGGSDISQTETTATPVNANGPAKTGDAYLLNGFKWFSSATDSEVALALARTGDPSLGSRSLSLFLLPLRLPLPSPATPSLTGINPRTDSTVDENQRENNGILIHRLKNKIGTHSLPTAELSLDNSVAYLIGPLNGGVKAISTVLQLTRVHSAFHSIGSLAKCFSIARSFAHVRKIDGGMRTLDNTPLHVDNLARVAVTYRALLSFAMGVVHLLGQTETLYERSPNYTSVQARFRLLNPVLKAFAAFHCVPAMEECMAALGGQGYMEETGIGRFIRDALVEKIWEGTENVLALDLIRASGRGRKDDSTLQYWVQWSERLLQASQKHSWSDDTRRALDVLVTVVQQIPSIFIETSTNEILPRRTLLLFGHVTAGFYLLEHAMWAEESNEVEAGMHADAFTRWILEGGVAGTNLQGYLQSLGACSAPVEKRVRQDSRLVFGTSFTKTKL